MRAQNSDLASFRRGDGGVSWKFLRIGESKTYPCRIALLALATIIVITAGCKKSEQPVSGPKTFASPDDAATALYQAAKAGDSNTLLAIFGPSATELIISGDPVQDKAGRDKFTAAYDQMHRWGKLTNGRVLNVGADNYPFPFPLVKNSSEQWYFDSSEAKDEIRARRIGDNELSAIDALNAMADAQADYFRQTHDGSNVHQYAQKFVSDEGKQNGLYWKTADSEPESPLGPLAAAASTDGYRVNAQLTPQPFHGYFYRIITKQGDHAQGGTKDYIVKGNMTGGYAILAHPADYLNSGVMSFFINQDGEVVQKDLGDKTGEVAKSITEFNPDNTWKPVQ